MEVARELIPNSGVAAVSASWSGRQLPTHQWKTSPEERGYAVGLIRKTMSLSTLGIVDYRGKDERAAKYSKQTRNAARAQVAQTAMMLENQRKQLAAADHANVREEVRDMRSAPPVAAPPAGSYNDQHDPTSLRWFDGSQWTYMTKPVD